MRQWGVQFALNSVTGASSWHRFFIELSMRRMEIGFLHALIVGLHSVKITRIMFTGVLGKPKRNLKVLVGE